MAVTTTVSRNNYLGTGNLSVYSYTFQILQDVDLRVATRDEDGLVSELVLGVDFTVTGVGSVVGGTVTLLAGNLASGIELVIMHDPEFLQEFRFNNLGARFYPELHEKAYDRAVRYIQVLQESIDRAIKFSPFDGPLNATLPKLIPDSIVRVNSAGNALILAGPGEFIGPAGPQGNPLFVGQGDPNDVVAFDPFPNPNDLFIDENGDFWKFNGTIWALTGDTLPLGDSLIAIGYSPRYGEFVNLLTGQEIVDYIFDFQYVGPTVMLSSNIGTGPYEKGNAITAITFTASVSKTSDPIDEVRFYEESTLVDTQTSGGAIPNGGSSTYNWTGSIADTTTFSVQVQDDGTQGGPTVATSNRIFNFVFAFYAGVGAAGLVAAQIVTLSKTVNSPNNSQARSYTLAVGEKPYFAYVATLPALTSIKNASNLETISSWTQHSMVLTNTYGQAATYRVYEFNNVAGVANSDTFTFIR